MKSQLSLAWAYTKIGVFSVLTLYLLLLFLWNRSATIDPGLSLPFIATYERPNAVLTLISTAFVAILTAALVVSFYKALKTVKSLKEKERLVKAERELAELQSKAVMPDVSPGPIPLAEDRAPETPKSPAP